jgi:hypothetical protein
MTTSQATLRAALPYPTRLDPLPAVPYSPPAPVALISRCAQWHATPSVQVSWRLTHMAQAKKPAAKAAKPAKSPKQQPAAKAKTPAKKGK